MYYGRLKILFHNRNLLLIKQILVIKNYFNVNASNSIISLDFAKSALHVKINQQDTDRLLFDINVYET